jgi:hypothetical protein
MYAVSKIENTNKAPEAVRESKYGCRNCLYSSAECVRGSLYEPHHVHDTDSPEETPSCRAYTYYD